MDNAIDFPNPLESDTRLNNWTLAPVVRKLDSVIPRINRYPEDKHYDNQLHYPVDSDLSGG